MSPKSKHGRFNLTPRIGAAVAATSVAAVFFAIFGTGALSWNSPVYWVLVALMFIVALIGYAKID